MSNHLLLITTVLLGAAATYLAVVLSPYWQDGRGLGTSRRDDLHAPLEGTFLLGNLFMIQKHMARIQECEFDVRETPRHRR